MQDSVAKKCSKCIPILNDGDWLLEIMLIETGEKTEYKLSHANQDPEAN